MIFVGQLRGQGFGEASAAIVRRNRKESKLRNEQPRRIGNGRRGFKGTGLAG
jgi:hypothetical protein